MAYFRVTNTCNFFPQGYAALHKAVFVSSVQIATYLVSLGANVNIQVGYVYINFCVLFLNAQEQW